jgi:glycosyltransferase involved in cell wall biosynthesis
MEEKTNADSIYYGRNKQVSKKKIALITSSPSIVLAFLQNHIKQLSAAYEVHVISNIKCENEKENLAILLDQSAYKNIKEFATIVHLGITRRISIVNDIKAIFSLWKVFSEVQFSSVHSFTSKAGVLVMIAGFLAGIKYRFHTYTGQVWANKKGIKRSYFKFMDKIIATLCTHAYADSNSQREFLVKENVIRKNKIAVLGEGSISGVDTERFFPDSNLRNSLRKSLSIPNNELVFLILCRLTKDKGVLDLAKAFSRLVVEISCSLLIVGPDEDNISEEIRLIVGSHFGSKLFFHGYTNCHEKYLNASDIICLPSYREGFGSVIIDAAATGIPAIGSDIYGIRDAIENEKTGILHKAGDIDEIYEAMRRLANDSILRKKLGEAALLRVKNQFTMELISAAWLNEYNNRLGR